jgi:Protein of unknown function (DUF3810)
VRVLRALVIAVAVAAAVAPLPAAFIERAYSRGFYRRIQPILTGVSSLSPVALLDVAVAVLLAGALVLVGLRVRAGGFKTALTRTLGTAVVAAAVVYLWFLLCWGFNYRRVPLEQKVDYDPSRITRERGLELGRTAVAQVNALVAESKATAPDDGALFRALANVQAGLQEVPLAVVSPPKRSLLELYFRRAAIDGMTNPFFLEIIVNPDLLPSERPFVVAHEWAHLAGYADESEANFIAWLTCLRASPGAQYSGWLAAYQHVASGLPPADRRTLAALLSPPVRADLNAERERFNRSTPAVRAAARGAYDTYLRANRIEEGIANYNAVVRLMLGAALDGEWNPRLR